MSLWDSSDLTPFSWQSMGRQQRNQLTPCLSVWDTGIFSPHLILSLKIPLYHLIPLVLSNQLPIHQYPAIKLEIEVFLIAGE